ncbi:hypothetical protein GALMADRAFT_235266 [Galerina marginata CBS 339.88]|uniref:Uncharacterized protein n=1 Tax=Galerina marginata (strain CBS 339.88) TaxID=685588 RepID=A0A067TS58_GALM3|nr:hypothetical protein GALMADRAFT_235266 [Galerina marginata CBS 339.88]
MPDDATTGDRLYFFGWPPSLEELKSIGLSHGKQDCWTRIDPYADYLRDASGFSHLQTVLVEPQTEEEKTAQKNKNGLGFLMLWVNETEHFHRIPTQGQVDKLVKILKREPEWYRDFYDSEDFDRHNLC